MSNDTNHTNDDAEQPDIDQTNHVQRTDHGVSITTEVKRGTGTRDQDKHTVKSKGATFREAREYHDRGLAYLDGGDLDDDAAVIDRVREWDPERDPSTTRIGEDSDE